MMGEYERERRDERDALHPHERDHLAHHARQVERERDYFAAQHAAPGPGPGPRRLDRERERDPRDRERELRIMSELERDRERERDIMLERERERDGVLRRDSLRGVESGRTGPSYNGPAHSLPAPPSLPGGPPLLSAGMHPPPVGIHAHPGGAGMFPPSAAAAPPVVRSGSALPVSARPPPPDSAHPYAMPHSVHPSQNPASQLYPSAPGPTPSGAMPPPPGALVDPLRERERERDRREREYAAAEHRERGRERDRIERERERERNLHLQQQQETRLLREREREREVLPRESERTAGIAVGTPLIASAASTAVRAGSHAPSLGGGSRVGAATTPVPGNAGVTTAHTTPIHPSHHHHNLRAGAPVVPSGPAPNGRVTPAVNAASPRSVPPLPAAGPPLAPPGLVNGSASTGPSGPPVPSVHAIQAAIVKGTEAPLHALAQANEQTWLLIGMLFLENLQIVLTSSRRCRFGAA